MSKISKIKEQVDVTTRDDIGEPTTGLTKIAVLKYVCPQCGFEITGSEDVVNVVCPNCEIPMLVKREESMKKLAESISSKVKRLRELVEQIEPEKDDEKEKEKEKEEEPVKEGKKKSEQEEPKKDEEPKKEQDEEPKKDDEKEKEAEKKSEQDEEPKKDDEKEKEKEPMKEEADDAVEKLPVEEPKKDEEPKKEEQEEEPKGEIDLTALLDFLNSKTGVAYEITNAVFDQNSSKLIVALTPDLPPEIADMKDEIADIFDTEKEKITVTATTVEAEGVSVKLPEADDEEGFPGIKIKDIEGVKVHFITAEGDEQDRLVCPVGYMAQDGKCVPTEEKPAEEPKVESLRRTLKLLKNFM